MSQNDIKAFVQNQGMDSLRFQQINLQIKGQVMCSKKEFCTDLPIMIQEVGMRETRPNFKTKVQKDGKFLFNLVKPGRWDVTIQSN